MKIKVIGSGSIWSKSSSACYIVDDRILIDIQMALVRLC